jgi:transcriptional regulator with XRE-family HTH domain/DNA-binding CsgD family transcriptional regulator
VTSPTYQQALGRKIAAERRRRGLSQPELARMIDRSVAWVSQVERGIRKIDRMSVLESLADALDVPLAELAAEAPVVAAVTDEQPAARSLRLVLSGAYALSAMLQDRRPRALTTLRGRVRHGWGLVHAAKYAELSELLGNLIPDLESAARKLPEERRAEAFELLATTYRLLGNSGEARRARSCLDRRRPRYGRRRSLARQVGITGTMLTERRPPMPRLRDGVIKRGASWSYVIRVPDPATGVTKPRWVGGFATEQDAQAARDRRASGPGALTDRQRAVVVLRLFDDLPEAQVARILGCAVGTVKATMSHALARLRSDPHLADLLERRAR